MPIVDFRDVTQEAPPEVHFPDYVRAFEDLGFVRLGRMERVIAAGLDEVARYYPEPHRDEFIQMKAIPQSVLAAQTVPRSHWWTGGGGWPRFASALS